MDQKSEHWRQGSGVWDPSEFLHNKELMFKQRKETSCEMFLHEHQTVLLSFSGNKYKKWLKMEKSKSAIEDLCFESDKMSLSIIVVNF